MTFQLGAESHSPGRPKGSRNRRTQDILDLIQGRGDKDPLDALSEIVTTSENPDHRISASNILAPYLHSNDATKPTPRFVPEPIEVPVFQSIDQAEDFLNDLSVRLGRGELDSQSALELGSLIKQWINSRRADQELNLKIAAQGGGSDQTIRIEGGMPQLPGTNIIGLGGEEAPPRVNGHNGHVIDHQEPPALDAATESTQSEAGDV